MRSHARNSITRPVRGLVVSGGLRAAGLSGCPQTSCHPRPLYCRALVAFAAVWLLAPRLLAAGEERPATKPNVTATVCSWREVEQRIRRYRGRPVVVDLWGTSCEPCLRELPELAAMQRQLGDRVVCVTVCLDYFGGGKGPSAELQRGALQVLRKHRVAAVNLICSTPDETVYQQLDLAAVPATLVYNAAGRLARRFDNEAGEFGRDGYTYKRQILPFVRQLLAATAD